MLPASSLNGMTPPWGYIHPSVFTPNDVMTSSFVFYIPGPKVAIETIVTCLCTTAYFHWLRSVCAVLCRDGGRVDDAHHGVPGRPASRKRLRQRVRHRWRRLLPRVRYRSVHKGHVSAERWRLCRTSRHCRKALKSEEKKKQEKRHCLSLKWI